MVAIRGKVEAKSAPSLDFIRPCIVVDVEILYQFINELVPKLPSQEEQKPVLPSVRHRYGAFCK